MRSKRNRALVGNRLATRVFGCEINVLLLEDQGSPENSQVRHCVIISGNNFIST